jgi:hypothetical protein
MGLGDSLFPATKVAVGARLRFEVAGLDRKHWSSAGPIRTIFKDMFATVGLRYFNPYSFRKTLALFGGQLAGHLRNTKLGRRTLDTSAADDVLQLRPREQPSTDGNHPVIC